MSARVLLEVAAVALLTTGCANRCDYTQTKCQYQCNRNYQVCELHGNDEFYCRNETGNCWVECDVARTGCHSWL
ncbi:hypothetical protein [Candidatus Binatus sp.]|uniref:hypothetical protein n=1 Tax=Candidatus Binatus sp. TaxID=2811406 RepID=UPI002F418A22